jgi:general secretion pathway protein G
MQERLRKVAERRAAGEGGFTLIELLVVIVILGILAAVVVFAVGGVGDKGQSSACVIDTRTIRTAEEAFFASNQGGHYTDMATLQGGFLSQTSVLHGVVLPAGQDGTNATSFKINVAVGGNTKCGATNDLVAPDGPGK